MRWLNKFYLYVGSTDFGQWWAKGLGGSDSNGKGRKLISYFCLNFLLKISSKK